MCAGGKKNSPALDKPAHSEYSVLTKNKGGCSVRHDIKCIDTPRIIWRGSDGLMEFIPVRDGHIYGRARINDTCWREFFKTIRPKLPAHIRTTKGLRKRITSSIAWGGPVPKCTFFFDDERLGSFFITSE
jgi:hypothetical protein